MQRFRNTLLIIIALMAIARCLCFLGYAYFEASSPLEIFHFEAVLVYLARRVSIGLILYPDWSRPPHVANFYGPLGFWVVGLMGRWTGAGLEGLFGIGRGVSLVCSLLTTLLVGLYVKRRYGKVAGLVGAVSSLGAAPMFGFSLMVRPDAMAETLGFLGFWIGGGRSVRRAVAGSMVLALAILAKQTAGVFLLATVAALFFSRRPREAWVLLGGCLASLVLASLVLTAAGEPRFVAAMLGQARLAPSLNALRLVVVNVGALAPDLFVFTLLGLGQWCFGKARESDLAAFTVVLVGASLASAVKPGAGTNYLLSLRLVEALAIGKAWSAVREMKGRPAPGLTLALVLGIASLWPGVQLATSQVMSAKRQADLFGSSLGRAILQANRNAYLMAADPALSVLTDSGMVALHQGERAAFSDPWMFRALVMTGQIDPKEIEKRLSDSEYDYLILVSPLGPDYGASGFGLSPHLARVASSHYVPLGSSGGLFFYGPIGGRTGPKTTSGRSWGSGGSRGQPD